jgi:hypothetical protein
VPEWLEQARAAADPRDMLKLLTKHLPKDDLARDEILAGWIGDVGNKRARAILAEQDQQRLEREKQEALKRGDLYALGQHAASELEQRQTLLEQQTQLALSPFMQGVQRFQQSLPRAVQEEVQGKTYAPDGTPEEGVAAYLRAVTEAAIRHGFDDEIKRREPALRKAFLSETVGSEPTPEVEGGPPPGVREITDEQLARMSLAESDEYLDERGQARPGVRVRITRGIPLRQR